jgi:hypothetical protein
MKHGTKVTSRCYPASDDGPRQPHPVANNLAGCQKIWQNDAKPGNEPGLAVRREIACYFKIMTPLTLFRETGKNYFPSPVFRSAGGAGNINSSLRSKR